MLPRNDVRRRRGVFGPERKTGIEPATFRLEI